MEINIFSRAEVLDFFREEPNPKEWSVISVREPYELRGKAHDIREWENTPGAVLPFHFSDVPDVSYSNPPLMDHVIQALKFAEGKEKIITHCFAGVSRSSALAYIIHCARTKDPEKSLDILNRFRHEPNPLLLYYADRVLEMPLEKTVQDWLESFKEE